MIALNVKLLGLKQLGVAFNQGSVWQYNISPFGDNVGRIYHLKTWELVHWASQKVASSHLPTFIYFSE
jgi:hypothetical protein